MSKPDDKKPTTLAEGRYVRLVKMAEGWEYAERVGICGIVVIVAVTDDGKLVLTEQFRPPVGAPVIELPAGLAGDIPGQESEPLENAARRELFEETGYEAARLEFLTKGPPSAGVQSEVVSFFLATGLKRTGDGGGDASETIDLFEIPLSEARDWLDAKVREGESMVDPKVYAGVYFAQEAFKTKA